jgi:phosphatidylinositol alpha-1,6-mannosyltransferase
LLQAWPAVRREIGDATLLLVGGGSYRKALESQAGKLGIEDAVVFTGSVPQAELPAYFEAGDVFAMPCRTRWGGLDVEGLVTLQDASASLVFASR